MNSASRRELWIAGRWVPPTDRRRTAVINPSNEQQLCTVADGSVADGLAAVDAAYESYPAWRHTPPRERAQVLRRTATLMLERLEEIAKVLSDESGKALFDSRNEVAYAADFFNWYAEEAVRNAGELMPSPSGQNRILVSYEPIGVCLLVTPWNFPAAAPARKIAPALAAGCTVVLKPAPSTPLTALILAELLEEAGAPAGVVNVIPTGRSAEVVDAILHDPRVRKLSFTGSTAVGKQLLRAAADQVISCSMELGGNAPFIVLDDANIDEAVESAMLAKMRNGGQACTAANRIFVHESRLDEFAAQLSGSMAELVVGAPQEPGTQVGPLSDLAGLEKVERLVGDAVDRGASAMVGGKKPARPGYFYEPTVLVNVPPSSAIMNEEVFGPVAALVGFATEDEVVARANQTDEGLAAYVMAGDLKRGLQIADRLEFGMVGINRGIVSDPAAPFGGVKASGLGREGSHHGLKEFCEAKYIATDW